MYSRLGKKRQITKLYFLVFMFEPIPNILKDQLAEHSDPYFILNRSDKKYFQYIYFKTEPRIPPSIH